MRNLGSLILIGLSMGFAFGGAAAAADNPVTELLPPILQPLVTGDTSPSIAGGDAASIRPARRTAPVKPPFVLRANDRLVFLGDSLVDGELALGVLETRITAQFPKENLHFYHLPWLTNHPLAGRSAPSNWIAPVTHQILALRPAAIVLAFGSDAAAASASTNASDFQTNLAALVAALKGSDTNTAPKLILIGPPATTEPVGANRLFGPLNAVRAAYSRAVADVAEQHGADWVNLFDWFLADLPRAKPQADGSGSFSAACLDERQRLTPYGFVRACYGFERQLRWGSAAWRFGMLPDNTMREGGFGTTVLEHQRTDSEARLVSLDARLPIPNVPGLTETDPSSRPQCYFQIPGFRPGQYVLRIDGQTNLTASERDWARFQIIVKGPQWDQAETLRQTIVQKNAHWREIAQTSLTSTDPLGALKAAQANPKLAEYEQAIARLRVPVKHTFTVAPDPTAVSAAPVPAKPPRRTNSPPPAPPPLPPATK
jgi:hypothetical protein